MYLVASALGYEELVAAVFPDLHRLGVGPIVHHKGVAMGAALKHKPERQVARGQFWVLWQDEPFEDTVGPDVVADLLRRVEDVG